MVILLVLSVGMCPICLYIIRFCLNLLRNCRVLVITYDNKLNRLIYTCQWQYCAIFSHLQYCNSNGHVCFFLNTTSYTCGVPLAESRAGGGSFS